MNPITLPDEYCSLFADIKVPTELRDPKGKVMGVYTPSEPQLTEVEVRKLFDLEAARRIGQEQANLAVPLDEVWRRIEARGATK